MSNTTDTKDKVIVGGALVGGLLFFGFLTNTCQSPLSYLNNGKNVAATSELDNHKAEIANLKNDIIALEDNSADENTIADLKAQLEDKLSKAQSKFANLSKQNADLEARYNKMSDKVADASDLNTKITLLNGQNNLANETITDLQGQLKSAMAGKPVVGDVATSGEQANTIQLLKNENAKLTTDLDSLGMLLQKANKAAGKGDMPDLSGKVAELEKSIAGVTKENTDLKAQIANLGTGSGDMDAKLKALAKMAADQKTDIATKNGEITKLNAQINQLKAAKNVFVKSSDDLPKVAQGLYTDLKALEGNSPDQVKDAYTQYLAKHNATSKLRVKFGSGSSAISAADQAKITQLTQAAGENAYFLIVGFADKSGTAASNEKLSSKRSTNVAKQLGSKTKGFQAAQAVYLGQTDRFGPASENRVVEIWEIK